MRGLKIWKNGIDDLYFGHLCHRHAFPVGFMLTPDPLRIDVECDVELDYKKAIAEELGLTLGDDGYFCFNEMKKYFDVWCVDTDWTVSAFGYGVFYGTLEEDGTITVESHATYGNELLEYVKERIAALNGKEDAGVKIARLCDHNVWFDENSVDLAHDMTDVFHLKENVFTRIWIGESTRPVKYMPNLTIKDLDFAIIKVNDEPHLVQYVQGWLVFALTPHNSLSVSAIDAVAALTSEIENYKGDK